MALPTEPEPIIPISLVDALTLHENILLAIYGEECGLVALLIANLFMFPC